MSRCGVAPPKLLANIPNALRSRYGRGGDRTTIDIRVPILWTRKDQRKWAHWYVQKRWAHSAAFDRTICDMSDGNHEGIDSGLAFIAVSMPRSKKKSNRLATTVSDPVAMCGEIACIDACCGGSAPYKWYARASQLGEITMTECLRRSRQWTGVEARHGLSTGRTALCIRRYRLRWRMRAEGIPWPRPRRFLLDMGSIGISLERAQDGKTVY